MPAIFVKDPQGVLDYTNNWNDGYLETGETISTSVWAITPNGLTQDSESETTTTATITVSGGTHGVLYSCSNRITTSGGRTDDRVLLVRVWERR